jgi:hypothetical protein
MRCEDKIVPEAMVGLSGSISSMEVQLVMLLLWVMFIQNMATAKSERALAYNLLAIVMPYPKYFDEF